MTEPHVEILYFDGCPNHDDARALIERIAAELQLVPRIDLVNVPDPEAAIALRFLGSPSVRVDGRDVEPGADERAEVAFSCRVYRSENGFSGQPNEAWVRAALEHARRQGLSGYGDELPPRVADALAAAEIPPSKLGAARWARLGDSERELYFWILRRFASHGPPTSAVVAAAAERLGLDVHEASATLAREDLVHLDKNGGVAVAYPFSGRPTAHEVRFENGGQVHAMCAIDALGIAPMFDQPIEISSRDPLSGDDVRAQLTAGGEGTWQPESAVVVAGAIDRSGDSFRGCCPVLNFFASSDNGERWLERHPSVRGQVVSMPEAIAAGRVVFGDVFH